MSRKGNILFAIVVVFPITLIARYAATPQEKAAPAGAKMTDAQKIANAMSAAPSGVSKNATIMDWPDTPNGKPKQLRSGTNGWVCYPSTPQMHPGVSADDPMCLDKSWQEWAEAWMNKSQPKISSNGIAYMPTDPKSGGPWVMWKGTPYAHLMVPVSTTNAAVMPSK
jgi:hypothetical protein